MKAQEFNFDGLVGPTHNYAGLSWGNIASGKNANSSSNPKSAALQGLEKMKYLLDLGVPQAVLPPQERPDVQTLHSLGFSGSDPQVLEKASKKAPEIFNACCSASSMWTANAATVSPSADTDDGRIHFTPANLSSKFHRSIEHPTTSRILKSIFNDSEHFAHHKALPAGEHFSDEGAANHTRLCNDFGEPGVELFVYGRYAFNSSKLEPVKFPARQTFEASRAIAQLHCLEVGKTVLAQQNPVVIDAGVFHNDVIAVGSGNVMLYHELAFLNSDAMMEELTQKHSGEQLHLIEIKNDSLTVAEAVGSYLFNSQLVRLANGDMAIIMPGECQNNARVKDCVQTILDGSNPISKAHYLDVRESMKNGGGPACLRLRVVLNELEAKASNPSVFLNESLYQQLRSWVEKHYRDELGNNELADPALLNESRTALDELSQILELGSVYPFQLID